MIIINGTPSESGGGGGGEGVDSINSKTGAVVLTSSDINGTDPTNGDAVDTQQNITDNLFQYANNGKTSIANAIGSDEANSSDTFTTLAGYITTDKGTIATNLTNDGVTASGTESLSALAAKIPNIADNGQSTIANAIGTSEASVSDSFSTLAGHITTDKSAMATNLTGKGVTANSSETLASLAGKISDINLTLTGSYEYTAVALSNIEANDILEGNAWWLDAGLGTTPAGACYGVDAITFGGNYYIAITCSASPYLYVYKWDGDSWEVMASPSALPGVGYSVKFNIFNNDLYLSVTFAANYRINIYQLNAGTWNAYLGNINTGFSGANVAGVDLITFGNEHYLSTGYTASPYLYVYKWSGSSWDKMNDPATLPTGAAYSTAMCEHGSSLYLAVTHTVSPYVSTYKLVTGAWSKIANPSTLPTAVINTGNSKRYCKLISYDGSLWLSVLDTVAPYVLFYKMVDNAWVVQSNLLVTYPLGETQSINMYIDGSDLYLTLSIGTTVAPYCMVYKYINGKFKEYTKLVDRSAAKTGSGAVIYKFGGNLKLVTVGGTGSPYVDVFSGVLKVDKITNSTYQSLKQSSFCAYALASAAQNNSVSIKILKG